MGYREHTAEFLKAVRGGRGELDAWLECNNEAECRSAILGAIEEEREACIRATLNERVDADATQTDEDEAYNTALMHAVEAMQKRSNDLGNRRAALGASVLTDEFDPLIQE